MTYKTKRNILSRPLYMLLAVALCVGVVSRVNAAYYPTGGDLYYNGHLYLDSYFYWTSLGPWSISNPGYEHDLWVHNPNFFVSTCVSYTNLPSGYNDCPTAGIGDPNGPVFSFGSFDADAVSDSTYYWGAWEFYTHGSAGTTPFNLQGQENENTCLGLPTIWCMYAIQTHNLITGWHMNWGGYPGIIDF